MTDYYFILGVRQDATASEIQVAYRRAALAHHPDRAGGSHERMKTVNEAYEVLHDPGRRAGFDQELAAIEAALTAAVREASRTAVVPRQEGDSRPRQPVRPPVKPKTARWRYSAPNYLLLAAAIGYGWWLYATYQQHDAWLWIFLGVASEGYWLAVAWLYCSLGDLLLD